MNKVVDQGLHNIVLTLDAYMDIILGLVGLPCVLIGFGEGVCRREKGQQCKDRRQS